MTTLSLEGSKRVDCPWLVIAISGALGSGKASLSAALSGYLWADRVSFGAEVRKIAAEACVDDPNEIHMLQLVGQSTVVNDCPGLVDRVLAQRGPASGRPLIISGVRHVEVLCELRKRFGSALRLIHVTAPEATREQRIMKREGVERRVVARYSTDLTEVQNDRILPQYASAIIDGSWPVELQVKRVVDLLGLPLPITAKSAAAGGGVTRDETFATIAQWCEETFGPIAPERIVSRAAEEMDELRAEPGRVEEAADVVIVLSRYPGLWDAVQRKMQINRARRWRLMGDGTGYHVKDGTDPAAPIPVDEESK